MCVCVCVCMCMHGHAYVCVDGNIGVDPYVHQTVLSDHICPV